MKIKVTMSPDEYDEYRAYKKEKQELDSEYARLYGELKIQHAKLCAVILKLTNAPDSENFRVELTDDEMYIYHYEKLKLAADLIIANFA